MEFNFFLESDDEEKDKDVKDKDEEKDTESKDDNSNDYLSDDDSFDSDLDDNDYLDDTPSGGGIAEEGSDDYSKITKCVYAISLVHNNLIHIHLHCAGKHFDAAHKVAQDLIDSLYSYIDKLSEIALQDPNAKIDNLSNAHQYVPEIEIEREEKYDYEAAMTAINSNLRQLTTCVKSAFDSNDLDDLKTLYELLNKEVKYLMNRRLEESCNLYL